MDHIKFPLMDQIKDPWIITNGIIHLTDSKTTDKYKWVNSMEANFRVYHYKISVNGTRWIIQIKAICLGLINLILSQI